MTDPIDDVFEAEARLCDEGRYEEAASVLEAFLKDRVDSGPVLAAVHSKLGHIFLRYLGQPAVAERYFRRSTELSPSSELASLGLFHSLLQQQKASDAFAEMRRLLERRPSPEYQRLMDEIGEVLHTGGETEE